MKKGILLISLWCGLLSSIYPQSDLYKMMFDSLKSITFNTYMTPAANDNSFYGDGISYTLEALLRMYEQTDEYIYLEDFINLSHEVIRNRDDNRMVNRNLPVWSTYSRTKNCYGPITHQTALILIPMVHYCYISEQSKKQLFETLYFEEEFITFNNKIIRSLDEYSNWLNEMIMPTIEYYDQYYWNKDSCMIQFADDSCETRYNIEGTDRQMNWAYVYLYLAMKDPETEKGVFYLNKYEKIVCNYRSILKEYKYQNRINYYLWPESGWSNAQNGNYEDISHAGAAIDLVQFSYENKDFIQQHSQNRCSYPTYFTSDDLNKFANTFTFNIYDSPLKYHNAIDGTCYFWRYPKNCEKNDFMLDYGISRWISLSKNSIHHQLTDAQVYYYMTSDFYTSYLYRPSKFLEGSLGTNLIGIANAQKYIKQFRPVAMIPLDSLKIKIPPITPVKGVLKNLKENQFSMLFYQEGLYSKEFKFEVVPNSKKLNYKDQTLNFTNIGFELQLIPLSNEEIQLVENNIKNGQVYRKNQPFQSNFINDSTHLYINTIGNTILIKDINDSILNVQELSGFDYLYCTGDFNDDHNDELILFNKTTGLLSIDTWSSKQNSLVTISNCKFPQDQFIEFLSPIIINKVTYLVVYRGSDKTINIYSIAF